MLRVMLEPSGVSGQLSGQAVSRRSRLLTSSSWGPVSVAVFTAPDIRLLTEV